MKSKMFLVVLLVLILPVVAFAGSESKSKADANAYGTAVSGGGNQTVESTQQYPTTPPIFPLTLPLIQNGRVSDITRSIPVFAIAAKPYNGEAVVAVLKIVKNIKFENLEVELLAAYKDTASDTAKINPSKIRYTVTCKDSATSWGIGGGGAGSMSAINNATPYGASGGIAVLPSYGRSTVDPKLIVKFFLVE